VTVAAQSTQSTQPTLTAFAGPILARRPRVLLPGLLPADPGLQRYRVRPGAVTALQLGTGDELTVIDVEGRQRGELTVFGSDGEDYRALGASAEIPDRADLEWIRRWHPGDPQGHLGCFLWALGLEPVIRPELQLGRVGRALPGVSLPATHRGRRAA